MTRQHLIRVISSFREKQLTIAAFFGGNSRDLLPCFSALLQSWGAAFTKNKTNQFDCV